VPRRSRGEAEARRRSPVVQTVPAEGAEAQAWAAEAVPAVPAVPAEGAEGQARAAAVLMPHPASAQAADPRQEVARSLAVPFDPTGVARSVAVSSRKIALSGISAWRSPEWRSPEWRHPGGTCAALRPAGYRLATGSPGTKDGGKAQHGLDPPLATLPGAVAPRIQGGPSGGGRSGRCGCRPQVGSG
jgi:hypothetical protein